ncbi:hypothetical protein A3C98_04735 [Candidatus Roizmanbacteria bacterium RIFCSPHIGHO2_02_FULL_37_15]|uniref:Endonuclease/exonuclease/phosphatase domain-containing protein n=1 Tax=Candidatus Roizmanbacteria bacterium RIFCSPLOWO2_01_FULL_37_16 TaxID=1802058 RepID=A0A1F7IN78_9BACT|nr:MAG: hypothetical protein A2859_02830 [Candidatus Roizmanbacteria bacterium RIFCSPHIGHO2_01_FULL_37_16b]OGK21559.1 MAG: hypothetical protein A3C98_04735 [Candidatus Roizmanbacteria bacterium RIFCSPHIGHO2_02_FULL_37_15]OGK31633.1 MAG: hypothetical protein A3F57_02735 [Candidatus Roizmanbacteria bacterium RIFCSPHIGHO2_12_FULL_36_11]OGK44825.1 MAG: hypothetical protein A3B40_05260 [Candidatus Roizmanbacteria bacterium RIFCSPLOWO2_01_FULL_37_16]OGK56483.1 MAG: hypothetical protein A3I50_04785 [C
MSFSLLTYNVLFNKAFIELEQILYQDKPEILCLQEVEASEKNLARLNKFGYRLADYSNSFIKFGKIFAVATYFNAEKLKLVKTDSFSLPKSIYEMFIAVLNIIKGKNTPRTILRTDFLLTKNKKRVAIYNIHLTVEGINRTRTNQLQTILNHTIKDTKLPIVLTGDFNYFPYRRKRLENLLLRYGFKEATNKISYTIRYPDRSFTRASFVQELVYKIVRKYFNGRLKVDYTFFKNIKLVGSKRVEKEFSDHYPIISTFKITK